MNILVTSAHYHFSDRYGSEARWAVDIVSEYAKQNHKVFAIAGITEGESIKGKVKIYNLANRRLSSALFETIRKIFYPIYSFVLSYYLWFKFKGNFDIVHHIAPTGPVSFDLFFIFRPKSEKTKFIIGPAMIPSSDDNPKSLARILGSNLFLTHYLIWGVLKFATPILEFLSKLTFRQADKIIAVTKEAKNFYLKFLNSNKIKVIPVGVNLERFKMHSKNVRPKAVILAVAYLTYRKGIDLLLKAVANLYYQKDFRNFEVVIVGSGEEEEKLRRLAKNLKIEKITTFVGFVENQNIPKYYSQADIFCSPTRHEPYGMNLIEAMAAGLPVVATDVNSVKELVGEAGLFFAKDDVKGLTDKLFVLLTEPNLRQEFVREALTRAKNLYSWDKIIDKYISI